MEGVAQAVGSSLRREFRPEDIHQPFGVQAVARRQGEELDERLRLTQAPVALLDQARPYPNPEAAQKLNA